LDIGHLKDRKTGHRGDREIRTARYVGALLAGRAFALQTPHIIPSNHRDLSYGRFQRAPRSRLLVAHMLRFFSGLTLAAVTFALAWAARSPPLQPPAVTSITSATPVQLVSTGEMLVTAEWFDLILRGTRQDNEPAPPSRLERLPRQDDDRPKRSSGTYRTLCVRICDGFYFPISYSTSRERFSIDAKQCEQRCPTRSRLFVHRNPGENVEDMIDLNGRLYRSLPSALLHRRQFVADCTCRGNPWDEAALARHRAYADAARLRSLARLPITCL
jgi:Protein of unknown function (DUF2865)